MKLTETFGRIASTARVIAVNLLDKASTTFSAHGYAQAGDMAGRQNALEASELRTTTRTTINSL
jgi:hypothetical protein